jgi:hypothetical protein
MSDESDDKPQNPEKRAKGRPRKSPGKGMIARNVSLSREDEVALKALTADVHLYYAISRRSSNDAIGTSWTVRALIRYAEKQTRGWMLAEPNAFLNDLIAIGEVDR